VQPLVVMTVIPFGIVGALAPMVFESSRQARFMIPMAVSLGYGVAFATAITLVLVPSLYLLVEDARTAVTWVASRRREKVDPDVKDAVVRGDA
jgi:hypothetical protein